MKRNHLNALCFGLIIATFYACRKTEALKCDPHTGPNGVRHCIKLPQFNDFQWSTCRTDLYIRAKTDSKHHCARRDTTYCYYQCMLDVYGENGGDVYGSCRCSAGVPDENPKPSSKSNTGVIIGTVAAAVIVIVAAIFIVGCFLFGRLKKQRRRDIGPIQNAAYEGGRYADRMPQVFHSESRPPAYSESGLPQVFYSQNDYGQPAKYHSSTTVSIDANFQSANEAYPNQHHRAHNENVQRDAPHNLNSNPANESMYEEVS